MRTMTLTVVSADGSSKPSAYTVTVSKNGKCEDLIQTLRIACSLGVNETLLVAEIYNNHIIRFLEEPTDLISLIRDDDCLVAYRLIKDVEQSPLVVFMHQRIGEEITQGMRPFGIPLVAKLHDGVTGSDIHNLYLKLLEPFLVHSEAVSSASDDSRSTVNKVKAMEEDASHDISGSVDPSNLKGEESPSNDELHLYLTDEKRNSQ